ncbi:MAG TPA: universal stress protein [Pseudonocardiaceae bacterium]
MSELERAKTTGDARRDLLAGATKPAHLDPMARFLGAEHYQQVRTAAGERGPAVAEAAGGTTKAVPGRRRIAVGIDGSESARAAAIWAAGEAVRRGTALRLVHALDIQPAVFGGAEPNLVRGLRKRGRAWLDEAAAAVRDSYPDLAVGTELRTGSPVPELIEVSRRMAMIVVGSRGLSGISGLLTGSTAVALAGYGECPVAVIREQSAGREATLAGPVVVGVDGSSAGAAALGVAFREASLAGAELVAVHTWSDVVMTGRAFAVAQAASQDMLARNAESMLDDCLAEHRRNYPDVRVRPVVLADRPAAQLVAQGRCARLLVVGSHGRGGFAGMVLGSVSRDLMHHAPCPLLIVRGDLTE